MGVVVGGESKIQTDIRDKLSHGRVRLFRNSVGAGLMISHKHAMTGQSIISKVIDMCRAAGAHAQRIRFGLAVGSGDLIGYRRVTITPDMVGREVAVFLSVEVKTAKGPVREEQYRWADHINSVGGVAVIARSLEQAQELLDKPFIGAQAQTPSVAEKT